MARRLVAAGVVALAATGVAAQTPADPGQAVALARGWTALAKGELAQAEAEAQRAVAAAPKSAAALALLVDVDIAKAGPLAGLTPYEGWLGTRRVDEPYVLRRIAEAHLQRMVRQKNSGAARLDALEALAQDGDPLVLSGLAAATPETGGAEVRVMAGLGDVRAVRTLIAQLKIRPDQGTIDALVASRSQLAVAPLREILINGREDDRALAADALARLGAQEVVDQIKPLLSSPNFSLRLSAASALYRLGDNSGAGLLDELLTSEHAQVRLAAVEALSVRPGGAWLNVLRTLAADPDESVQLGAARLLAPHDRELAESVLNRLAASGNPAIREEAGRTLTTKVANEFRTLRTLLRSPEPRVNVAAAARILELTR